MGPSKYYIVDMYNSTVQRTDSDEVAANFATSEEYVVINIEKNTWDQERIEYFS